MLRTIEKDYVQKHLPLKGKHSLPWLPPHAGILILKKKKKKFKGRYQSANQFRASSTSPGGVCGVAQNGWIGARKMRQMRQLAPAG